MKLSDKTVRIYGWGLFEAFMGLRLAEEFKEVEIYTPWESSYPHPAKSLICKGLPNITKIDKFWEDINGPDLFCFFDVGCSDIQEMLRKMGKRVYGNGTADNLEFDRIGFKKILKSVGLPVAPYKVVKGMEALIAEVRNPENKGKWVKVSRWRAICETFQIRGYYFDMPKLDSIAYKLGAYRHEQEFIIEDSIPGVEPGEDNFFAAGEPLPTCMYGFENKDKSYLCKAVMRDELPMQIKRVTDSLLPIYRKHNVSGMLSSEIRIGADGEPYFIDCCSRAGSPPSELTARFVKNFAQVVWGCAEGEIVVPEMVAKYGAEVLIKSAMAPTDFVPLDFEEKDLNVLMLRNLYCNESGQYFYVPQDGGSIIGGAIGFGDTAEEAQAEALANADKLECEDSYYSEEAFDETDEELEKAERYGLGTF